MNLTPEALAEQLKDVADELELSRLVATQPAGRDSWTTVEVHHAALLSDARDGWDVTITKGSL